MRRLTMPRLGGLSEGAPAASSPSNPNLLLWSQELNREPPWSRTSVTQILTDNAVAPDDTTTAELVTLDVFGAIREISTTAATSGAGDSLSIFDVATTWTRYEIAATFDIGTYVFSVYLKQTEAGIGGRILLDRSGGFLRCSYEDVGDGSACWVWGMQLEAGATATAYVKREGS